jgi:hypothetical protein
MAAAVEDCILTLVHTRVSYTNSIWRSMGLGVTQDLHDSGRYKHDLHHTSVYQGCVPCLLPSRPLRSLW